MLAGHVLNVATATGTSPDPNNPTVTPDPAEDDEPTTGEGHLTVTKDATNRHSDGTPYTLGETIEYEVTVLNDGSLTITDINVTDELTNGAWNIPSLAPGQSETFTTSYVVTEADVLAGHVLNVATATGKSPDPNNPTVTPDPAEDDEPTVDLDCSSLTAEIFLLNDCETSMTVTLAGEPTVSGLEPGTYRVENNLSELNPLSVGTHTITWTLYDLNDQVLDHCDQTVTVEYKQCSGVTWQGYPYEAVRIGSQCWLTENLRWNTGSAVAYREDNANVEKFGYLYSWYTAVGVPEGDDTAVPETQYDNCGNPYVQGICPPGWGIGSQADHDLLNTTAGSTSVLKDPSTLYWLPGYQGVADGTGFDARGGGWYNSALSRFEDYMTNYYFWKSDSSSGSTVSSSTINYYCDDILTIESLKSDKKSVRCVRKVNE